MGRWTPGSWGEGQATELCGVYPGEHILDAAVGDVQVEAAGVEVGRLWGAVPDGGQSGLEAADRRHRVGRGEGGILYE